MAKFLAINWRDLKNPDAGGAEVHLHEIMKRLVANGHDVTLVCSNFEGGATEDVNDGIRILRHGKWYNANFVIPYHVWRLLKKESFDLIIEDINKIPFFSPLLTKTRIVAVVPHLFGATVFRETNVIFGLYVYFWELLIPPVFKKRRFAVISPSTKTDLIKRGIPKDKIDVVLCGLDHSIFRLLDGVERFERPTVIHFGRIRKYKSVDVVIRAFEVIHREIPSARLLIVGGGPGKGALVELVDSMGLNDSVEFTGVVPTPELVKLLNQSHLFINASPKEGWGLTVVEANACGVPVVASRRPGLKDSVLDERTGYLVKYGDHEQFAVKSLEILKDPARWKRMSDAGLEWARSLTWDRCAAEMESIFLEEISWRSFQGEKAES